MRHGVLLGAAAIIAASVSPLRAADTYIGPTFPPTGSASFAFSGGGALGAAGGRTFTYTGLDPSAYVSIFWGPTDANAAKMSLNSNSATNVLALSSSTSTNATFTNTSVPYASPGGPGAPPSGNYTGRGTIDLTGSTWTAPPVGVSTSIVTDLTGLTGFGWNGQWTSNATGSYTPINTLPTSTGVASGFGGSFFYIPRFNWTGTSGNWDTLTNWNHQTIAPYASSPVTINVNGGSSVTGPAAATTVKSLTVGGAPGPNVLTLGAGSITATDGITIAGEGTINGPGSLVGAVTSALGTLNAVGGPIAITGSLSNLGRVIVRFGTGASEGLNVAGNIALGYPFDAGGDLTLKPAFTNAAYGTQYTLIHGTSVNGIFGSVTNISLSPTKSFAVIYDAQNVRAVVAKPGDANLDGAVNFADLVVVAQHYNFFNQVWVKGDFDGNGAVEFGDLVQLAQNYNSTASFQADWALAQSLVPEPTTLAAVALSGVTVLRRRRRAVAL